MLGRYRGEAQNNGAFNEPGKGDVVHDLVAYRPVTVQGLVYRAPKEHKLSVCQGFRS